MINTIIFDFGDVFINLDKQATVNSLRNLVSGWHEDLDQLNIQFETGQISREAFIDLQNSFPMQALMRFYRHGVPSYSISFIDWSFSNVVYKIPLILLSNTDAIHIETFEQKNGATFYSFLLKSLFLL
jgi:putative hydrolase of the HAD superfamily